MSKPVALVRQHLEWIPREAIEDYQDILRQHVKGRHGVYALYRGDELYYVGLASNLSIRLNRHLKDRHGESWDRFSVYLTISDSHMKELESLVLRMVEPSGNKQRGRFVKSADLLPQIETDFLEYQRRERARLFGGRMGRVDQKTQKETVERDKTDRKFTKSVSAADYMHCAKLASRKLGVELERVKGSLYASGDERVGVYVMVSRTYGEERRRRRYWFGVSPHQIDALSDYRRGYFVFGCGPRRVAFVVPLSFMKGIRKSLHVTRTKERMHWHVRIFDTDRGYVMVTKKGLNSIPINKYMLSAAN